MSLPRKSFARKIIRMKGYTTEEEITEVACLDKVSREEAAQRIELARTESKNRSVAQYLRQCKARDLVEQAAPSASFAARTSEKAACRSSEMTTTALSATP